MIAGRQGRHFLYFSGQIKLLLSGREAIFFKAHNEIGTSGKTNNQTNKQKRQLRESSLKLFMSFVILALSVSEWRL